MNKYLAVRLTPGMDVRRAIEKWCLDENIDAASILSMVGSFEKASIRFANQENPTSLSGPFEIVSCTGTLGKEGIHVHVSIADKEGKILGGHLSEGCTVNTTIELTALNLSEEWEFKRVFDPSTNAKELKCVRKRPVDEAQHAAE